MDCSAQLCDVCGEDDSHPLNLFVYCDGGVHEQCYGITGLRDIAKDKPWLCRTCVQKSSRMRICAVCETAFDGMMASVDGGKTWVHVVCAKYHPHYSVNYWDSGYFREVVVKTGEDTDDFLYTPGPCCYCSSRLGYKVKCSVTGCARTMHPVCGRRSGSRGDHWRCTAHLQKPESSPINRISASKSQYQFWEQVDTSYFTKVPKPEELQSKLDAVTVPEKSLVTWLETIPKGKFAEELAKLKAKLEDVKAKNQPRLAKAFKCVSDTDKKPKGSSKKPATLPRNYRTVEELYTLFYTPCTTCNTTACTHKASATQIVRWFVQNCPSQETLNLLRTLPAVGARISTSRPEQTLEKYLTAWNKGADVNKDKEPLESRYAKRSGGSSAEHVSTIVTVPPVPSERFQRRPMVQTKNVVAPLAKPSTEPIIRREPPQLKMNTLSVIGIAPDTDQLLGHARMTSPPQPSPMVEWAAVTHIPMVDVQTEPHRDCVKAKAGVRVGGAAAHDKSGPRVQSPDATPRVPPITVDVRAIYPPVLAVEHTLPATRDVQQVIVQQQQPSPTKHDDDQHNSSDEDDSEFVESSDSNSDDGSDDDDDSDSNSDTDTTSTCSPPSTKTRNRQVNKLLLEAKQFQKAAMKLSAQRVADAVARAERFKTEFVTETRKRGRPPGTTKAEAMKVARRFHMNATRLPTQINQYQHFGLALKDGNKTK